MSNNALAVRLEPLVILQLSIVLSVVTEFLMSRQEDQEKDNGLCTI